MLFFFFFFNDTATTEIYTLSLHDALPISQGPAEIRHGEVVDEYATAAAVARARDPLHVLHDHAVPRQSLGQLVRRDEPGEIVESLGHGVLHVLLRPDELQKRGDGAVVGEEPRSEERRVGKECRSRWSPYH